MQSSKLALFLAFLSGTVASSVWGLIGGKQPMDDYHAWLYDESRTWYSNTAWMGTPIAKTPQDLWLYQELIHETKPDVLLETGTLLGGSALYFASLFDLENRGRVVTVDIVRKRFPQHPRITYVTGSSVSPDVFHSIQSGIRPGERVMVSLDSDHHKDHVLRELRLYSDLVTPGCYLVVEDTNINGHPVARSFGPGPAEAVAEFLRLDPRFTQDRTREKFGISFNPGGWLRRIR